MRAHVVECELSVTPPGESHRAGKRYRAGAIRIEMKKMQAEGENRKIDDRAATSDNAESQEARIANGIQRHGSGRSSGPGILR
jgi:hypothetical protein